jgi:hypothetical protein
VEHLDKVSIVLQAPLADQALCELAANRYCAQDRMWILADMSDKVAVLM